VKNRSKVRAHFVNLQAHGRIDSTSQIQRPDYEPLILFTDNLIEKYVNFWQKIRIVFFAVLFQNTDLTTLLTKYPTKLSLQMRP
jgi:hypothetical protein